MDKLLNTPAAKFNIRYIILSSTRFKIAKTEIWFEISAPSVPPPANSAMMSTLTVHCLWEDDMVRERTGLCPQYAEAKKIKSPTPLNASQSS